MINNFYKGIFENSKNIPFKNNLFENGYPYLINGKAIIKVIEEPKFNVVAIVAQPYFDIKDLSSFKEINTKYTTDYKLSKSEDFITADYIRDNSFKLYKAPDGRFLIPHKYFDNFYYSIRLLFKNNTQSEDIYISYCLYEIESEDQSEIFNYLIDLSYKAYNALNLFSTNSKEFIIQFFNLYGANKHYPFFLKEILDPDSTTTSSASTEEKEDSCCYFKYFYPIECFILKDHFLFKMNRFKILNLKTVDLNANNFIKNLHECFDSFVL